MYHHRMSDTPFWDRAKELARTKDYVTMDAESGRARSHGWWRRLVENGPWGSGYNTGRVGPPDREAIDGIATLFGTSPERVAEMIAADWYGVRAEIEVSDRVLNLSHVLDALSDEDAKLVERMARRLADDRGNVTAPEREEASPAA
jgi:hypothetical protein